MEETQGRPFFQLPAPLQPLLHLPSLEPPLPPSAPETLTPHCWTTVRLKICQNYSTQVGAHQPPGHPAPTASHTHLPLGSYFDHEDLALQGLGHFFGQLTVHLLKRQNQRGDCVLFQDMLKPSQDAWGKTQAAVDAASALTKNLTQALVDLQALVLPAKLLSSMTPCRTWSWVSRCSSPGRWPTPGSPHRPVVPRLA